MPREFVYDGRTFPDPDESMEVDEVRKLLADFMPELQNAKTLEHKAGETTVYEFQKQVGTKG